MPSAVNADHDKNNQEIQKPTIEHRPKTEAVPSFFDIEQAVKMSPAIEKIYSGLETEGKDRQQLLEEIWDLAANEIIGAEGVEKDRLLEFQNKIEKMLEEKEHTFESARSIFENAVISAVNEGLPEEGRITSSDGNIRLEWLVDEETSSGHFVLAKRKHKPYSEADEPGEYITLVDEKTGKEYKEKKLSDQTQRSEDMKSAMVLETENVKEVFHQLKPEVKQSFLDGLKEQIQNIAVYHKQGKEEDIAKIEKELAALA